MDTNTRTIQPANSTPMPHVQGPAVVHQPRQLDTILRDIHEACGHYDGNLAESLSHTHGREVLALDQLLSLNLSRHTICGTILLSESAYQCFLAASYAAGAIAQEGDFGKFLSQIGVMHWSSTNVRCLRAPSAATTLVETKECFESDKHLMRIRHACLPALTEAIAQCEQLRQAGEMAPERFNALSNLLQQISHRYQQLLPLLDEAEASLTHYAQRAVQDYVQLKQQR